MASSSLYRNCWAVSIRSRDCGKAVAKHVTENFQLVPTLEPTMLEAKVFSSGEVYGILNDLCNARLMYYRCGKQWWTISSSRRHAVNGPFLHQLRNTRISWKLVCRKAVTLFVLMICLQVWERWQALAAIDKMNITIEKMNASIEGLTTENKELKNTSIKSLEKKHEKDIAKLFEELLQEKKCRSDELESIRKVHWDFVTVNKSTIIANINCSAYPLYNIHLRVLLDLTRLQILKKLNYNTWEDLRQNRLLSELSVIIHRLLSQDFQWPSYETIEFVRAYNNIRRDGNTAAHWATREEMREAVTTRSLTWKIGVVWRRTEVWWPRDPLHPWLITHLPPVHYSLNNGSCNTIRCWVRQKRLQYLCSKALTLLITALKRLVAENLPC